MDKKKEYTGALKVHKPVPQPPSVNPDILKYSVQKKRKKYSADEFVSGILIRE